MSKENDSDFAGAIFIICVTLILAMILFAIIGARELPIERATEFCEPHGIELATKRPDGGVEVTCKNGDHFIAARVEK